MKDDLITVLNNSVKTGEVVHIIYHGGSQPGSSREISPITVTPNEVRARDLSTGIVKVFLLSKIELFNVNSNSPIYDPNASPIVEDVKTIEQAFISKITELEKIGWNVVLTQDAISLHSNFKNGKIRKSPDVSLSYDEFIIDSTFDLETNDFIDVKNKSTRPYRLCSKSLPTTHTVGHMLNAIDLFLKEAKINAPSSFALPGTNL